MSILTKCLASQKPCVVDLASDDLPSGDPTAWALQQIRANAKSVTLQIMKWDRDIRAHAERVAASDSAQSRIGQIGSNDIYYLDANDPDTMNEFIAGVQQGRAMHARLELFNVAKSSVVRRRADVEWPFELFRAQFLDELQCRHPLGFFAACTLWLSSGRHIYGAHTDVQDAFLLHLGGNKRIRIWPTPDACLQQAIYNYDDKAARMASDPVEYDLDVGQIVFIPHGAVHEVVADGSAPAISISYHMGSPYPLLILRDELNRLAGREVVSLPPYMTSTDKASLYFFQPSDWFEDARPADNDIPRQLADRLLDVLISERLDRDQLRGLLVEWWQDARRTRHYVCPYPDAWQS